MAVEVYCAAPEVELLCNGESLGRREAGPAHNFTACFDTIYRPGTLTAIAWDGGTEVGRTQLATAGQPHLRVTEDTDGVPGGNLHWFDIELVDGDGVVNAAADRMISIQIENGRLLGFGSANPKPEQGYQGTVARTWQGRAQAVVWSEGQPAVTVKDKED